MDCWRLRRRWLDPGPPEQAAAHKLVEGGIDVVSDLVEVAQKVFVAPCRDRLGGRSAADLFPDRTAYRPQVDDLVGCRVVDDKVTFDRSPPDQRRPFYNR